MRCKFENFKFQLIDLIYDAKIPPDVPFNIRGDFLFFLTGQLRLHLCQRGTEFLRVFRG